jgi:hypothetical protein
MPRSQTKPTHLSSIDARREALRTELAALDEQAKAAELAARDAGRPVLLAALDRIKIPAMEKSDARAIATAIAQHGASVIGGHLASIPNSSGPSSAS